MRYRVTFHKPGDIQFNVETFDDAVAMSARITELAPLGHEVQNIDQFEAHRDPDNVRFDYESGARIQYADAADASEHRLRMMGG